MDRVLGTLCLLGNKLNAGKRLTHCFSMRTASIDAYFNHCQMLSSRLLCTLGAILNDIRNLKHIDIFNDMVGVGQWNSAPKECNRIDELKQTKQNMT